jgi:hypothetical protein
MSVVFFKIEPIKTMDGVGLGSRSTVNYQQFLDFTNEA